MPRAIETRCASSGAACLEVLARLEAAHRTIYAENCREHGEELLAIARRIADVHRQENELREAG